QGAVIARYEDYALDGMSAPRLWQAGDKLNDSVAFPLPPPGSYSVWAGLQHRDSGDLLPVFDSGGNQLPDGLLRIGELQVTDASARALSN
ncbi:MAG TPA: hypothetical protein VMM78_12740, partial [Thermomicrobiales bacterium]|nr:hypothetical protein [Thermomicrobiales bacterium]